MRARSLFSIDPFSFFHYRLILVQKTSDLFLPYIQIFTVLQTKSVRSLKKLLGTPSL